MFYNINKNSKYRQIAYTNKKGKIYKNLQTLMHY